MNCQDKDICQGHVNMDCQPSVNSMIDVMTILVKCGVITITFTSLYYLIYFRWGKKCIKIHFLVWSGQSDCSYFVSLMTFSCKIIFLISFSWQVFSFVFILSPPPSSPFEYCLELERKDYVNMGTWSILRISSIKCWLLAVATRYFFSSPASTWHNLEALFKIT